MSEPGEGGDGGHPGARTSPLHERLLDGEERDRLAALRAATETNAPQYAAILSVLAAARDRYEVELRTDRIAEELARAGVNIDHLESSLDQLRQWGNVTWTQDTARVNRLEDFRRRRALWQLTAVGQATHDAIHSVLGASDQAGSLQRTLFRDIRDNLAELATAIDASDPETVYLRLRDLDGSLQDLARNARDFHAAVAQLRREHDLDPERFIAYKHLLIEYLEQFLEHLMVQRSHVASAVADVNRRGVDRLATLAATGDDSAGLFEDADLVTTWRSRWRGLEAWFSPVDGRAAGADELEGATTGAIRDLLALLRRMTESARRPITRASELVVLARWFRALASDAEAAELFDAAFGLGRPLHLSVAESDRDPTAPLTSWWDAPPVQVGVTLREHGRRPSQGRPGQAADYRATKRRLADEHRLAQQARTQAAARLCARPIEGRVLSESELHVLLELLDRAAHQRRLGHPDETIGDRNGAPARVQVEGVWGHLEPCDEGMTVRTARGELSLAGHRLVLSPVETGLAAPTSPASRVPA